MAVKFQMQDYERQLARMRSQLSTASHGHRHWYERTRLLENAIRDAVREIDPDTRHAKIQALAHRIPKHPRKSWRDKLRGR